MRLLADLLSASLNATIIGFAALLLAVANQEPDADGRPVDATGAAGSVYVALDEIPRSVIAHLFEWRWDDVAEECERFLGPGGFAAVQVSPPNEHRVVAGGPWWQRYEPVSYRLDSRSGDADAFAEMVRRCAAAGVRIYVDLVINHMTGPPLPDDPGWGSGSGGSRYDYYDYPGLLPADFHQPPCQLDGRWTDRAAVQRCNVDGRADLDTGAERVKNRIAAYLNRLVDLGVQGFRIDAAKHMAPTDIAGILARVEGLPFVYQSFVKRQGEAVQMSDYLRRGAVTELGYTQRLAAAFRRGDMAELRKLQPGLGADDLMPARQAVVFVDSHQTRHAPAAFGGDFDALSPQDGQLYELAQVFMLAWPYGTPRVMSGYAFNDVAAGPPSDDAGVTLRVHGPDGLGCGADWLCEHRQPAIAGMVGFRNQTDGAEVANWWSDDGGRMAFGRGARGFVVINNTDAPMRQRLKTGLPAGRYCNAVVSRLESGSCRPVESLARRQVAPAAPSGDTQEAPQVAQPEPVSIIVGQDTSATFELAPRSAAAIHVGLRRED